MKEVRPTSGKVTQALFNILGPIQGKSFLDLFSGTGRIAMEACRRGADTVTAVELDRRRCSNIRKAVSRDNVLLLCMNVRRALVWLDNKGFSFDFIFADPPYNSRWVSEMLKLMACRKSLLKANGLFILEHSTMEEVVVSEKDVLIVDHRQYGDTLLTFFAMKGGGIIE